MGKTIGGRTAGGKGAESSGTRRWGAAALGAAALGAAALGAAAWARTVGAVEEIKGVGGIGREGGNKREKKIEKIEEFGGLGRFGGEKENKREGKIEEIKGIGGSGRFGKGEGIGEGIGEVGRSGAMKAEEKGRDKAGAVAALEEAFWETLADCESPILSERDAAEDALFRQFAKFEPIWQDRRFLTNGELGAEARRRFELAEARFRGAVFADCVAAFEATFETERSAWEEERKTGEIGENRETDGIGGVEGESERERGERGESGEVGESSDVNGIGEVGESSDVKGIGEFGEFGEAEEGGESGETGEVDGAARGRVELRWGTPLRIVYLTPDWSAFERRDDAGRLWRPSGRFSAPELAPEFDATKLVVETTWERVDPKDAGNAAFGECGEDAGNAAFEECGEDAGNAAFGGDGKDGKDAALEEDKDGSKDAGGAAVVGVFEGLIGADFRVWRLPLGELATEDGGNGENREDKEDKESGEKGEVGKEGAKREREERGEAGGRKKGDFPPVFQSGDATAIVKETLLKKNGETTARVRFEFAEAFDAFDSHRVWCDKNDFVLIIEDERDVKAEKEGGDVDEEAEKQEKEINAGNLGKIGKIEETGKGENWAEWRRNGEPTEAAGIEQEALRRTRAEAGRRTAIRLRTRERSARGVLLELDFPNEPAIRAAVEQGRARLECRVPRFFFWARIPVGGEEKTVDSAN